jgi:heme exporter protein A
MAGVPVLLEAGALTVRRGRRTVLSGVGLTLDSGRAIHLSGPNGSGKTSLLRVLAGLATPRAGTVRRHGACAFVPEKVRLAPALRAGEWLRAMRALRGLTGTNWAVAAEASGLDPAVLDRPAGTFSRGMLQRLALLEALHAGCPLLLLDEPFSGLDDEGRAWLAGELGERLDGGAAVLLTDHSGAAAGRLPLTGVLRLRDGTAEAARVPRAIRARAALTVRAVHPDGRRLERTVAEAESDAILRALLAAGWHVEEVRR